MQLNKELIANTPSNLQPLGYDRSKVSAGILHIGVGQFFRSHLLVYVRDILRLSEKEGGKYNDWGVIGANVMKGEREKQMQLDFEKQDCLYTLTLTPSKGESEHYLMGSMLEFIYAPEEEERFFKALTDPKIRILSLTITEGGYNIDEKSNEFDLKNKNMQHDLANPQSPKTSFGYIVEGLRRRREAGIPPFTIMSCDNLRHNGDVAKKAILGFARAVNPSLATWIEFNVQFPNSMVDRITPATCDKVRDHLNKKTGMDDAQPVLTEDFYQWVIEDKFNNGERPPWDRVGATFSNDVAGHEHAKQRILNSSHIMLTFPSLLLGLTYVHEAMEDPDIYRLVNDSLERDVLPSLRAPDGVDLVAYKDEVLSRFCNHALGDQLLRVAGDGCSKIQVFWTATISALLKQKRDHKRFAYGVAAFIEMLNGKAENGTTFEIYEPKLNKNFKELIASDDLALPLRMCAFDPWRSLDHAEFDRDVVKFRKLIKEKGARAAMPIQRTKKSNL